MYLVSPAVSQLAQRTPRKQTHPVLRLQRAAAWRQTRKLFIAPSVKPVSIAAIGVRNTCSIPRSALARGLIKTGCDELSKWESSSDSVR
jgi:hypothetical protein